VHAVAEWAKRNISARYERLASRWQGSPSVFCRFLQLHYRNRFKVRVVECFFEGIEQWPAGDFLVQMHINMMMYYCSICIFVHGLE
jgi:hypothetical protein